MSDSFAIPWTIAHEPSPLVPGKNTGVGGNFLLPGIFLTQGLNSSLPALVGRFFTTVPPASPYTCSRMTQIKKTDQIECGEDLRELSPNTLLWKCKMIQLPQKFRTSQKRKHAPHVPDIQFQERRKQMVTQRPGHKCPQQFYLWSPPNWQQARCPSTEEWKNKLRSIYIMDFFSEEKKKKWFTDNTIWINLKNNYVDTNNKCWRGSGEEGTLLYCWWDCKLMQPLWKIIWSCLKKLKIESPHDPAVPLLGIYLDKTII